MLIGWLCLTSHRQRGHLGHLLSLVKDMKLGKYTVPIGWKMYKLNNEMSAETKLF